MKCRNAREAISSYLDDRLDQAGQAELNRHMENCSECSSFLQDLQEGLAMLHEIPLEEPSPNFEWNLKRKLQTAMTEERVLERYSRKSAFWPQFTASAAAALLIALGAAWLWLGGLSGQALPELDAVRQPSLSTVPVQPESGYTRPQEGLGSANRGIVPVGMQDANAPLYQGRGTIQPSRPEDMGPFLPEAQCQASDSDSLSENTVPARLSR